MNVTMSKEDIELMENVDRKNDAIVQILQCTIVMPWQMTFGW